MTNRQPLKAPLPGALRWHPGRGERLVQRSPDEGVERIRALQRRSVDPEVREPGLPQGGACGGEHEHGAATRRDMLPARAVCDAHKVDADGAEGVGAGQGEHRRRSVGQWAIRAAAAARSSTTTRSSIARTSW